ncbi:MAG: Holliday junction resolvase, partial [Methanoregulaceae archaeon]|nr:Holliday junction resolvase [Methanoregulaceae archaeon]
MDLITAVLLISTFILAIGLLILAFRYATLAGVTESRARQLFEEWKVGSLESEAAGRADILNREWV